MSQVQPVVSPPILMHTAIATADMLLKADRFAKWVAAPAGSQELLGFALCGVADEPDGFLFNQPASGKPGTILTEGRRRIELGGTVAAFDEIGPGADGVAVKYPAGTGYAKVLRAGTTGKVVDCIWIGRRRGNGGLEANDAGDTLGKYAFLHKVTIGSAGAEAATLPNGAYVGQEKIIEATVVGSGTWVLTGVFMTGVTAQTTATYNAVGDKLRIVWDGTSWFVYSNTSVTMG